MAGRRRLKKGSEALEVSAFINLIVVLVPFLLSTAVFSRMAVVDLTLPAKSSNWENLKADDLKLEVVVRHDAIEVGDKIGGLISRIPGGETLGASPGADLLHAGPDAIASVPPALRAAVTAAVTVGTAAAAASGAAACPARASCPRPTCSW